MDYGSAGECARCNRKGVGHTVSSNPKVEAMAMTIAQQLEPICRTRGRMLGVMYADGEWIITLSHVAAVQQEFVQIVLGIEGRMSPIAHDWSTIPKRSMGGHDISGLLTPTFKRDAWQSYFSVYDGAGKLREAIAGGPACVCAAPKLISYLTQDAGASRLPPREFSMVELWCGASLVDSKGGIARSHKQIAKSCSNCERVLPTLLCR
jgi:hypothetical protein